ncbi:hypothetical protein CLV59_105459 [Chitinophaga dinghuensis]|uniref:Uncharacterized protein n=1 Tax=Chitinophaga dinghuensis TaxID=1539050 RepID=A0A327VYY3_9BACT|nr:hypothetical protein [Chitinophaga dinghuensis]RAJ80350.1 hypothetical protein CLV59_105459 [Chitinophaga dinghuensis]
MKILKFLLLWLLALPAVVNSQSIDKVYFDTRDSAHSFYYAVPPLSGNIQATLVVFTGYYPLKRLLVESGLHNAASGNDILTVYASQGENLVATKECVDRMNAILKHVAAHYKTDTSRYVLAGYDIPGNVVLRYAELAAEKPAETFIHPRAVMGVGTVVSLEGLWNWTGRMIEKNYNEEDVMTAKFVKEVLTKQIGTLEAQASSYAQYTPFNKDLKGQGNEKYLRNIPLRLYYDTDINWYLKNGRNSLLDTPIPDATAIISSLLMAGNPKAEFIQTKQGLNSSGFRHPVSFSIVDEVECIQWIKAATGIFDPVTYQPVYKMITPDKWTEERFGIPADFAMEIPLKGVEDIRFASGWGEPGSEEHWTYAFLWWLEGRPQLNAALLQNYLTQYYKGLVGRNIGRRNIPADKVIPVTARIQAVKTLAGDEATYEGSIHMLNYMQPGPITLNTRIHIRSCPLQQHTAVYIELSPKPYKHTLWQQMDRIGNEFDCRK